MKGNVNNSKTRREYNSYSLNSTRLETVSSGRKEERQALEERQRKQLEEQEHQERQRLFELEQQLAEIYSQY